MCALKTCRYCGITGTERFVQIKPDEEDLMVHPILNQKWLQNQAEGNKAPDSQHRCPKCYKRHYTLKKTRERDHATAAPESVISVIATLAPPSLGESSRVFSPTELLMKEGMKLKADVVGVLKEYTDQAARAVEVISKRTNGRALTKPVTLIGSSQAGKSTMTDCMAAGLAIRQYLQPVLNENDSRIVMEHLHPCDIDVVYQVTFGKNLEIVSKDETDQDVVDEMEIRSQLEKDDFEVDPDIAPFHGFILKFGENNGACTAVTEDIVFVPSNCRFGSRVVYRDEASVRDQINNLRKEEDKTPLDAATRNVIEFVTGMEAADVVSGPEKSDIPITPEARRIFDTHDILILSDGSKDMNSQRIAVKNRKFELLNPTNKSSFLVDYVVNFVPTDSKDKVGMVLRDVPGTLTPDSIHAQQTKAAINKAALVIACLSNEFDISFDVLDHFLEDYTNFRLSPDPSNKRRPQLIIAHMAEKSAGSRKLTTEKGLDWEKKQLDKCVNNNRGKIAEKLMTLNSQDGSRITKTATDADIAMVASTIPCIRCWPYHFYNFRLHWSDVFADRSEEMQKRYGKAMAQSGIYHLLHAIQSYIVSSQLQELEPWKQKLEEAAEFAQLLLDLQGEDATKIQTKFSAFLKSIERCPVDMNGADTLRSLLGDQTFDDSDYLNGNCKSEFVDGINSIAATRSLDNKTIAARWDEMIRYFCSQSKLRVKTFNSVVENRGYGSAKNTISTVTCGPTMFKSLDTARAQADIRLKEKFEELADQIVTATHEKAVIAMMRNLADTDDYTKIRKLLWTEAHRRHKTDQTAICSILQQHIAGSKPLKWQKIFEAALEKACGSQPFGSGSVTLEKLGEIKKFSAEIPKKVRELALNEICSGLHVPSATMDPLFREYLKPKLDAIYKSLVLTVKGRMRNEFGNPAAKEDVDRTSKELKCLLTRFDDLRESVDENAGLEDAEVKILLTESTSLLRKLKSFPQDDENLTRSKRGASAAISLPCIVLADQLGLSVEATNYLQRAAFAHITTNLHRQCFQGGLYDVDAKVKLALDEMDLGIMSPSILAAFDNHGDAQQPPRIKRSRTRSNSDGASSSMDTSDGRTSGGASAAAESSSAVYPLQLSPGSGKSSVESYCRHYTTRHVSKKETRRKFTDAQWQDIVSRYAEFADRSMIILAKERRPTGPACIASALGGEDFALSEYNTLAVFDGTGQGGHQSAIVAASLRAGIVAVCSQPFERKNRNNRAHHLLSKSHESIQSESRDISGSSTAVVAALCDRDLHCMIVGDSRMAYLRVEDDNCTFQVEYLSRELHDPRPGQERVSLQLGASKDRGHSVNDGRAKIIPRVRTGDIVIVASDGFWKHLKDAKTDQEIKQWLVRRAEEHVEHPIEQLRDALHRAVRTPLEDDLSIVVARIRDPKSD